MSPLIGKLSKREKVLLFILLIVIIVASMGTFLLKPAIEKNSELNEKLFDLQSKEMLIKHSVSILERQKESTAKTEKEIEEMLKEVFPIMTNNTIDKFVTDLVLKYHLEPRSLTITDAQTKYITPYLVISNEKTDVTMVVSTISIKLEGQKDDLVLLLEILASSNVMKVSNCTINSGDNGTMGGINSPLNIALTFDIYMHENGTASVTEFLEEAGITP